MKQNVSRRAASALAAFIAAGKRGGCVVGAGGGIAIAALLAHGTVQAQAYPDRPIRILVPAAAGDGSDVQIRLLTDHVSRQIGQRFIVENRPGAGGTLAAREAARASPNGYLLMLGTTAMLTSALIYPDPGYDPERSFVPITRISRAPMVMLVPASLGVADLAAFLKLARESKEPLHYASGGKGTIMHISSEFLQREAKLRMEHVLYKGAGPGLVDLVAGRVQSMFVPVHNVLAHAERGRLRILMVADDRRMPKIPDVPAATELGYRDMQLIAWSGVFSPAGTPRAVTDRLTQEFMKSLANDEVAEAIRRRGGDVEAQAGSEFAEAMRLEMDRFRRLMRDVKFELD